MKPYYQDDAVTIYHGDCREITEWLSTDVLVTDPPYGIAWRRGLNKRRASRSHAGIAGDADTSARDEAIRLWGTGPAIIFGSFYAPFPVGLRQVLVWHKPPDSGLVGATTGFRRDAEPIFVVGAWPVRNVERSSVLHVRAGQSMTTAETGHPHTKPVALVTQLLEAAPSGVISDPFMGSGSTLVAAKLMGRQAIGVDIEERWCERAARRCSQEVLGLSA